MPDIGPLGIISNDFEFLRRPRQLSGLIQRHAELVVPEHVVRLKRNRARRRSSENVYDAGARGRHRG